jgi:hypothetical protein
VPGFVPTEEWHREQQAKDPNREGFVIGHALNTAIGEGATRATVMQMALLYTALANGGRLWLPQIVERIETPRWAGHRGVPAARPPRRLGVGRDLTILRKALIGVVNDPKGTRLQGALEAHRGGRQDRHGAGAGQLRAEGRSSAALRAPGARLVRGLRARRRAQDRLRRAGRARRPRRPGGRAVAVEIVETTSILVAAAEPPATPTPAARGKPATRTRSA